MRQAFRRHWRSLPTSIRRPLTLFVGLTLVLTSGAIGWLPGPGGIPVFLLGIFVLASEFKWADDFGRIILKLIHDIGQWFRQHRIAGIIAIIASLAVSTSISYMLFLRK